MTTKRIIVKESGLSNPVHSPPTPKHLSLSAPVQSSPIQNSKIKNDKTSEHDPISTRKELSFITILLKVNFLPAAQKRSLAKILIRVHGHRVRTTGLSR